MKKFIGLALIVVTIFTFVGCSQTTKEVNVPVNDILVAIKEQMSEDMKAAGMPEERFQDGKLPGFMEVDLTEEENPMAEIFDNDTIEEGIVLQQMINIKSDLIIVLKAKDKSNVEDLKVALEKVKEQQVNTWSQYLPDQYEKVQNNIIKAEGKYLVYITNDNPENIEEVFENSLKQD
jgi:uncharacterized protein DUF4358